WVSWLRTRCGAAGSTRMASLPAMRMSWRRRRANSATGMPVTLRMSVEAAAVARPEHAVAVQQQGRHPHELFQLGERGFVLLVLVDVLDLGAGQLAEVLQRLAAFLRQRRVGAGGQAEGAEEAAAPVEQGLGAVAGRGLVVHQQQLEGEVAVLQLGRGALAQAVQGAAGG